MGSRYEATHGTNRQEARKYLGLFVLLLIFDACLIAWHTVLIALSVKDMDHEVLIGLVIATAHFLANSVAISDIFFHLWNYTLSKGCDNFEPTKSSNCFLISIVGGYADLATIALAWASNDEKQVMGLYVAMFAQSVLCAIVSISLYDWGKKASTKCSIAYKEDTEAGSIEDSRGGIVAIKVVSGRRR